jgi:hypothetical protein
MANVVANLTEEDIVSVVVYADRMLWNFVQVCFSRQILRRIYMPHSSPMDAKL